MSDGATPTTHFDYSTLNPNDPTSIQALIDFHRTTFGGSTMMADAEGEAAKDEKPTDAPAKDAAGSAEKPAEKPDQPLGEPGKKALEAERDAAHQAKQELAQFKKQIATAFGLDSDSKGAKPEDMIAALADKVAGIEKAALVATIASDNGITDPADKALIAAQPTAEAMAALAGRLKPAEGTKDGKPAPKPDPSIGKQGGAKPTSLTDAISAHYNT